MVKYFIFILIPIGLALPLFVNAGFLSGPIVPCGTSTTSECTLCDIFKMGQNIINFIWELIIVIVPIFILAGGILILTAGVKPDQVSLGKKIIFNAIIGMVIAFLSWTIINTVFNTLVGEGKKEGFPWPWNEIQCKGGGVVPGTAEPITEEGEYCVCEVPVYDLNPNEIPEEAGIIGTNIKATKLADKDTCKQGCVSGNANTYCPFTLTISKANLYCTNKSTLQNKKACAARLGSTTCRIGTKCYNSETECLNDGITTFKGRCFLNGQNLCTCYTGAQENLCGNSSNEYVLFRLKAEEPYGGKNVSLWDCPYSDAHPCRLNCQIVECEIEEEKCNLLSSPGSCFGSYTCQKGVINQQGFASDELKKLLTCMAGKNYLPLEAREISSIMDNSGGRCLQNWNSQCSTGQDSCEGTCCGHGRDSLHYGGDFDKRDKSACRINSWAVDFGKNTVPYKNEIESAAKECAEEIPILKEFGKGKKGVQVQSEGDHIHLELDGIARYYYKCM